MMTDLILKYLSLNNQVKISGFGIFYQKDSPAFYDETTAALLPPGKELFFTVDFDLKDNEFARFFAGQKNMTIGESEAKILETANYWKSTLENNKELEIPELGNFYVNDTELVFKGKRLITHNPDNFGLEEVNLSQLKKSTFTEISSEPNDYKKSTNKVWWLLFILPAAVIIYYATQNPELIFGKKSFPQPNKIKSNPVSKKDSLKNKTVKMDSVSLKNTQNAQK